jgi:hypothetical protein
MLMKQKKPAAKSLRISISHCEENNDLLHSWKWSLKDINGLASS